MSILQLMATRGAGAAAWTPANLSNKVAWLRASDITGKVDGDTVTAWPDSFGLISDLPGSGTYKTGANGIGGQPAIDMNGGTNFLSASTGSFGDFSLVAVFKPKAADGTNVQIGAIYLSSPYVTFGVNIFGGTNAFCYLLGTIVTASLSTSNQDCYLISERSSTTGAIECNTVTGSKTVASTAFSSVVRVDANNHLMSELIVLNGVMTTDEKINLRTYITDTYGITTS